MAIHLNKMLDFLKLTDEDDYDEDYYDDYEDDIDDEKELKREEKRIQREQKREEKKAASFSKRDYDFDDEPVSMPKRSTVRSASSSKVVPIHTASSDFEVCIIKPVNFNEAKQACDILIDNRPVVVNLEGIDVAEGQRIMDFIAGCVLAISGGMHQVSRYIFIFSPKNVDISGDYIENVATGDEEINVPSINREF